MKRTNGWMDTRARSFRYDGWADAPARVAHCRRARRKSLRWFTQIFDIFCYNDARTHSLIHDRDRDRDPLGVQRALTLGKRAL